LLEEKREAWSASLEYLKQELKQLQDQSDLDTEEIVSFLEMLTKFVGLLGNAFASNIFSFSVHV
jgi:hypothetical protein